MTSNNSTPDSRQSGALALLGSAQRFILVGHVRPDGDCVGGQGALARGLIALGKDVVILNPDHPGPAFEYLYGECPYQVYQGGALPPHDVVVLLDFNELSRCGRMAAAIEAAESKKLVIDHHPAFAGEWWDECYVDVSASATGILVWRILGELGVEIDTIMAASVFTSIVTDTGWFRYSNTDVETLEVAANIVKRGVDTAMIFKSIYQRTPATEPRAIASLLGRSSFFADGRLAVVDQPLSAGDADLLTDSDAVLDILRAVGDVEVVLYLREIEPGVCKLSARSKTTYDVNALARKFGGGGHVKASGATIEGDLPSVRTQLIEAATKGFE